MKQFKTKALLLLAATTVVLVGCVNTPNRAGTSDEQQIALSDATMKAMVNKQKSIVVSYQFDGDNPSHVDEFSNKAVAELQKSGYSLKGIDVEYVVTKTGYVDETHVTLTFELTEEVSYG